MSQNRDMGHPHPHPHPYFMGTQKQFRGILQPDGTALKWVVVKVPFDPVKAWPVRNRLKVKGTINGFPFRTSLFGSAKSGHLLLVNKQMQKGAGVALGGLAEVVLEPDLEERVAEVPAELAKLLKQDRALKTWFDGLSYSARADIGKHITVLKSPEARMRRAEQMTERMMLAMDGERDLPPILQVAFRRQPRALAGWKAMTPVQRRGHLLGIFYYQTPEARRKRADKAVAEALKRAGDRHSIMRNEELETIAAIRTGLDDLKKGKVQPARKALKNLGTKLGIHG